VKSHNVLISYVDVCASVILVKGAAISTTIFEIEMSYEANPGMPYFM